MAVEVIMLSGGLGNQMFQYAFYLQRSSVSCGKVYIDDYSVMKEKTHNGLEIDSLFNLKYDSPPFVLGLLVKLIRKIHFFRKSGKYTLICRSVLSLFKLFDVNVIEEIEDGVYNEAYIEKKKGISVFLGYWQTEKYFIQINELVRQQYAFKTKILSDKSKDLYEKIVNSKSVSIHIRKGDYLSSEYYATHGCVCNNEYYEKAISIILSKRKSPSFVVFSDDIGWVKKNLNIPGPVFYVDWNKGKDSWQDMYLMSQCRDNIIANSSFSWWAAWLNPNPEKIIISPSSFLANKKTVDTVPDTWIKL